MYFIRTEKNEFTNEKSVSTISVETAINEMKELFRNNDYDFSETKKSCLFVKSDIDENYDEFKNVSIKFEPVLEELPTLQADKE